MHLQHLLYTSRKQRNVCDSIRLHLQILPLKFLAKNEIVVMMCPLLNALVFFCALASQTRYVGYTAAAMPRMHARTMLHWIFRQQLKSEETGKL
jgi:hypothetical protein